jgi:ABC-type dipeptide/oligopeptide/nickel transport system permease component/ABC-type transport system substrate-binding protein
VSAASRRSARGAAYALQLALGFALALALTLALALPSIAGEGESGPGRSGTVRAGPARDRIVVGMQLEPPILDPTASPAAAIAEMLYGNLFEGLVQFAPDGSTQPKLAESWDLSADGLTYVFHLRAGVRFSDGTPFDAAVAKFSLARAMAPASVNAQRARLASVAAIDVLDARTVAVRLTRRTGSLLEYLAGAAFVMVAANTASGNAQHPVGTGPFRFVSWRRGDSVTLERNPDYWGGPPALAAASFRFIADPTAAYAALMAGDVDAYMNYPAPESLAQFQADPRFTVFVGSTETEVLLGINERRAPLGDLRVRRAIAAALDRSAIIDGAMYGFGLPIGSHFPPGKPGYVDLTRRYPHDPAAARALLAEAGYPAGFALDLKLPPPAYARRSGEIVAAELGAIGIRVRIQNLEWSQWLDQVYTRHDYDLSIVGHAEPMDYDIYARDDYYFGYSDPQFKSLIAALEQSVHARERAKTLAAIQRKLADDAVNGFLFQYPRLAVWNVHLRGLEVDNVLGVVGLGSASFDGRSGGDVGAPPARSAGGTVLRIVRGAAPWGVAGAVLAVLMLVARRFGPAYVLARLAVLATTLVLASAVVFLVVQIVPGDPVRFMMGLQADPAAVAALRHELGLDVAAGRRYLDWIGGLLRGEFGTSYTYRVPVRTLIAERLEVSAPLAAYALALTALAAFPLGLLAAARRDTWLDRVISVVTQLGLAIPNFWLGLLLVIAFALELHWVSAGGFPGWHSGLGTGLAALTLPALALAIPQAAILARVLRSALVATLHEDYVRTARAQGAGAWRVLWHHALPNALLPVVTILGLQFSFLLAGAVLIENVFFLPGLGRLLFLAIEQRDLIVVQSVVILLVGAVVLVSFCVDLAAALVDPRLAPRGVA